MCHVYTAADVRQECSDEPAVSTTLRPIFIGSIIGIIGVAVGVTGLTCIVGAITAVRKERQVVC